MVMPARTITAKQRRFVDEYLVDCNPKQAAIRAGYSAHTAEQQAYQLLQKTSVKEAVDAAKANLAERTLITAAEVIEGLKREATYHGDGASHSARVAALGHLAKIAGAAVEKHEHRHEGGIVLRWQK